MDLNEFQSRRQHPLLYYISDNIIPAASYALFMLMMLALISCPFWLPSLLEQLFGQ
jgi:hypothetical protein